jgi:4-aminobutyrate aminotransferase-like enzyme
MSTAFALLLVVTSSTQAYFTNNVKFSLASNLQLNTKSVTALHASNTVEDYGENVMNTYGRYPMTISHGKGSHLFDTDGNKYLDMCAGIATCCLGHSHPALKKAVSDQMDKVHHCSNLYFIPEQAALAKWLVTNSCADKVPKLSCVFFSLKSNGTCEPLANCQQKHPNNIFLNGP